jgi:hypothetical protein
LPRLFVDVFKRLVPLLQVQISSPLRRKGSYSTGVQLATALLDPMNPLASAQYLQ